MDKLLKIFKTSDLRKKIFFVLGIIVIFRLAAAVPIPGIKVTDLSAILDQLQFLSLLSTFTGGGLESFSIVMLGLSPYITGSIIMQLLTMIFPQLEQMYKYEGEAGKQKFNQYSRILTVPLAFVQGFGFIILLRSLNVIGELTTAQWVNALFVIAAGSVFLMWLGELITEKNIGNGVSLLIFTGIVSGLPSGIQTLRSTFNVEQAVTYGIFVLIAIVVIAGVVYLTEAQRNIPINYARRVRGNRMYGGVSTYLPMRVNNAGVMPIIFAVSILLFPGMIANFMTASSNTTVAGIGQRITDVLSNGWIYGGIYFVMVIIFTYFYTAVTFDPKSISENIQKQGGYVPGIRPGKPTADFLTHLLNRITLVGAIFLGIIAILPQVVQGFTGITIFTVGGTSILIVVSVVLELIKAIDAQVSLYEY